MWDEITYAIFIHSQTSSAPTLKIKFQPTHYWTCDYLSMPVLKLAMLVKGAPGVILSPVKRHDYLHLTQVAAFTNCVYMVFQIQWKLWLAVTPFQAIISLPNSAYAMTMELPCHIWNLQKMRSLAFRLKQNEIFKLNQKSSWIKNHWWTRMYIYLVAVQYIVTYYESYSNHLLWRWIQL